MIIIISKKYKDNLKMNDNNNKYIIMMIKKVIKLCF